MGDRESNPSHAVLETASPALEHAPILPGSLPPPGAVRSPPQRKAPANGHRYLQHALNSHNRLPPTMAPVSSMSQRRFLFVLTTHAELPGREALPVRADFAGGWRCVHVRA